MKCKPAITLQRLLVPCLVGLVMLSYKASAGENDSFYIRHYDNRNGLSSSAINYLYKDADSLLWIATWDGLNMYDGTTFHVFNYSKEHDYKSIGSNVIRQVAEDRRGNIWVTTIEGVSRYHKRTGHFYNYFYNQQGRVSEQDYALAIDTAGNVYCLDKKTGLNYYDPVADKFIRCNIPLPDAIVSKLLIDAAGRVWMLDATGRLSCYQGAKRQFTVLAGLPVTAASMFIANGQLFFTTYNDQLWRYNEIMHAQEWVMTLPHPLAAITYYKAHYLLAWATKGYAVYNQQFTKDAFMQQPTGRLQEIRITCWANGSEDILWYGTDGNGLINTYPQTNSFGTMDAPGNGQSYNKAVRAFCEVGGELWVGYKGNGIRKIPAFRQAGQQPSGYITAPALLDNNAVYALEKGKEGLVYIGTDARGIGVYDIAAKRFYKWADIKGSNAWPEFGSVYAIRQDADLSCWLGTSNYGLVHLRITRQQGQLAVAFIEKFQFNNTRTGPANDIIYALAAEGDDKLWVGCRYGGLCLFNKRTRMFTTFKAFTYEGSLSNNDVLSLYKDSKNRLWIGTSYGLNCLNTGDTARVEPLFKKYTTENGLPNNTIHAITEDNEGNVWVSTNKGLARLNASGGQITGYQQSDGLQSNEFSDGAVWKDKDGRLFFGGVLGFNQFLPGAIRSTAWLPNLLLSGMLLGGKEDEKNGFVVLHAGTTQPLEARVDKKDNFFELSIRAISFLNAEKCEYAWLLEGYDKTWHYGGTNGKIMYSNMPPGNYLLHIKWSNGEGTWSGQTTLLSLTVRQYLWLRWYALLFYALLAAGVYYLLYSYRKNKRQIRHELEMEHRLREKDETMHQNRIGFFTNIAHELQTPLTLIMGAVERFMDKPAGKTQEEKPYFISLIHQQASRLTYLVQQLMEFRKGEAGFASNQLHFMEISELLYHLAAAFVPLSEQNRMEYEFTIAPGITGWMDKDKLEKIIFNLLSNAFKHAAKNEQVFFTANTNAQTGELEISVTNPAAPLPQEVLDQLFDQFYVSNTAPRVNNKFGTGIGLAFTRQLVTLLNGRITVSSGQERICFKVTLPLGNEMLESHSPMQVQVTSDQPSLLYRSVTRQAGPEAGVPAEEQNKQALLDALQEKDMSNILLVEDDPDIRFLVRDILKAEYIVHEATDGLQALEQMKLIMPDLVICDVMMPNMDGLEFCQRVKNAPATCHIPIIMLSARGSQHQLMEGYEVGADAYLAKPFQAAFLQLRVRKMLEYRRKLVEVFTKQDTIQELEAADLPGDDKQFLTDMIRVIEENMADVELNALFLEKALHMSKMQLYRKLKTLTHMTPGEFIRVTRLRHAATLLVNTRLSVAEIFYRTGFNNQSYFFREFRKMYHCAPGEYRDKMGVV